MTIASRKIAHVLAHDARRERAPIWPYVAEPEADERPKCFGDLHRASLQVGAPTYNEVGRAEDRQRAVRRQETARLDAWLVANLEAIPRVCTLDDDVLPLVSADVFDKSSDHKRRQLMLASALRRQGFVKTARDARLSPWCRGTDLETVTERNPRSGRRRLIDVPPGIQAKRDARTARNHARLAAAKAQPAIVGTWATTERRDDMGTDTSRERQQRYRDRQAGRPIAPYYDRRLRRFIGPEISPISIDSERINQTEPTDRANSAPRMAHRSNLRAPQIDVDASAEPTRHTPTATAVSPAQPKPEIGQ